MTGQNRVDSSFSSPRGPRKQSLDLNPRQVEILDAVRTNGAAAVSELATRFGVTSQTIRRDLNLLEQKKLLVKGFGGAFAAPGVARYTYKERHKTEADIKAKLVEALKPFLFEGATIFVGLGTTFHTLHNVIVQFPGILVATPNLEVVHSCSLHTDATVFVYGGYVRNRDTSILRVGGGEGQRFKFDIALIGASAIDREGSVLEFDPLEVDLTRQVLENSRKLILVVHEGKFDRHAPHLVTDLSKIDVLVTNGNPADHLQDARLLEQLELVIV